MPVEITSRKNEIVKEYLRLAGSPAYRCEKHRFSAEGARLCTDAALSGITVAALMYTDSASQKYGPYLEKIRTASENEYIISPAVAQYISDTKHPQGIFCVCISPEMGSGFFEKTKGRHLVVLENIQDPANLGAVLRTAEALGIGGVILAGKCCDPMSPKVLRTSMGALFRLPLLHSSGASEIIAELNAIGYATFAAVPDNSAHPVTSVCFNKPSAAVIGNEGNGLTEEVKHACTASITIPMKGRAESLNAAASAAILMWEMMRDCLGDSDR